MKIISTLLVVGLAFDLSIVRAADSENYDGGNNNNNNNFPFERAAGAANNFVPAGSAAYNNPNSPPMAKVTRALNLVPLNLFCYNI